MMHLLLILWVDAEVRVVDRLVHRVALLLIVDHVAVALWAVVVVEERLSLCRLHLIVLLALVFVLLAARWLRQLEVDIRLTQLVTAGELAADEW